MNFLRIADIPNNRTGGMGRFMHCISDELGASGHHVDFLFREEIALWLPHRIRRFVVPLRVVQLVRQLVRQGKQYDAVEIHEPIAAAYGVARRLDRSLPPMLVVSYGLEHRCHLAMLAYYRKKEMSLSLKRRYGNYSVIWQANAGLRLADQVTVESREDRDFLITRLGIPANRISIVNGGVTQAFLQTRFLPRSSRGALFLATWIDRKGILDVVPALARVLDRHPNLPITVAGFGGTVESIPQKFPAQIRERIQFIPSVTDDNHLLDLYQNHTVFLAPSVFEGQMLTMLEAAAARLAIVTTNTCGMKDFICHGVNGLLVEPGDPDSLADHTLRLIEDPAFAGRLGEAAQETARTFSWQRSAEQFLTAAEAAIAHAARGRKHPCGR